MATYFPCPHNHFEVGPWWVYAVWALEMCLNLVVAFQNIQGAACHPPFQFARPKAAKPESHMAKAHTPVVCHLGPWKWNGGAVSKAKGQSLKPDHRCSNFLFRLGCIDFGVDLESWKACVPSQSWLRFGRPSVNWWQKRVNVISTHHEKTGWRQWLVGTQLALGTETWTTGLRPQQLYTLVLNILTPSRGALDPCV